MLDNPWTALAAWLLSYVADYYLTLYSARLYRAGAKDFIAFDGSLELTPDYQNDIDHLRRVSPRFILAVLFSVLIVEGVWYLSTVVFGAPYMFKFLVGGLVLREAAVSMRHARDIALFRAARHGGAGLGGQLHYARWLSLRLSAIDLFSFAALFGLLAPATGSWLLAGRGVGRRTGCKMTRFSRVRRATE